MNNSTHPAVTLPASHPNPTTGTPRGIALADQGGPQLQQPRRPAS